MSLTYSIVKEFVELCARQDLEINNAVISAATWTYLISFVVWISAFYIFKSVAVYLMAKNNNVKPLWLSFIPFANYYVIGKLIGKTSLYGLKIKNIGLIVGILLGVFTVTTEIYDVMKYSDNFFALLLYGQLGAYEFKEYNVLFYINQVGQIAIMFFIICMSMAFTVKYSRKNAIFITIILAFCIFSIGSESAISSYYLTFMPVFAIVTFCLRNKKPFVITEYNRYAKRNGNYSGTNYNPHSNMNNGYDQQNNNTVRPEDEPFSEYGANNGNSHLKQDIFSDF